MPHKKKQTAEAGKMIRITQVRSIIGYEKKQREVVRGLGLRRIGHSVEVLDHPVDFGQGYLFGEPRPMRE